MGLKEIKQLVRPTFNDYDYCEDDEYLDAVFSLDECLRTPQLVPMLANGGRIPWTDIIALLPPGTPVVWENGWQSRGAPVMNPIAQFCHWTAASPSSSRPAPSLGICINGRPKRGKTTAVPGPLCHCLVDYNGVIHVIASGRANHAGAGDTSLINLIKQRKDLNGSPGRDNGGSGGYFIGYEIEFNGRGTFSPAQIASVTKLIQATGIHYGWKPEQTTVDHARWTRRKIDIRKRQPWPTPDVMRRAVTLLSTPHFILQLPNGQLHRWDGAVANGKRFTNYIKTIPEVESLLRHGYRQVKYSGKS